MLVSPIASCSSPSITPFRTCRLRRKVGGPRSPHDSRLTPTFSRNVTSNVKVIHAEPAYVSPSSVWAGAPSAQTGCVYVPSVRLNSTGIFDSAPGQTGCRGLQSRYQSTAHPSRTHQRTASSPPNSSPPLRDSHTITPSPLPQPLHPKSNATCSPL